MNNNIINSSGRYMMNLHRHYYLYVNIDLIHNLDIVSFFIYPDLSQILDKKSLLKKWLPE